VAGIVTAAVPAWRAGMGSGLFEGGGCRVRSSSLPREWYFNTSFETSVVPGAGVHRQAPRAGVHRAETPLTCRPCRRPPPAPPHRAARAATGRPVVGDPTEHILAAAGRLFRRPSASRPPPCPRTCGRGGPRPVVALLLLPQPATRCWPPSSPGPTWCPSTSPSGLAGGEGSVAVEALPLRSGATSRPLSALPFDINEIHRIAARQARAVSRATGRSGPRLERRLAGLVRGGASPPPELREVDPRLTTLTIPGQRTRAPRTGFASAPAISARPGRLGGGRPHPWPACLAPGREPGRRDQRGRRPRALRVPKAHFRSKHRKGHASFLRVETSRKQGPCLACPP